MTRPAGRDRICRVLRRSSDALSGRMGIGAMVLAYSVVAVVMLVYVSGQVYTGSLMEDITQRQDKQRRLREQLGFLTMRVAALSSQARVATICREEFGMVEVDAKSTTRVLIDADQPVFFAPRTNADERVSIPEVIGSIFPELSEASSK